MFGTLLKKEIISHILSLRFGVTFVVSLLLVFASLYVTTNSAVQDREMYHSTERAARDVMEEMLATEGSSNRVLRRLFNDQGRMDAVPVAELSGLSRGLRSVTPPAVTTTVSSSQNIGAGRLGNPLNGLLKAPDLVYTISVVISLLAILFAFDSVCGEKEAGTLRLMLSNAVPRDVVLLAKWVGGYVTLMLPMLIAVGGGLAYALWKGALPMTSESAARVAAMLGVGCLYISVFFTLSVAISTLTHRASTSLLVCLLVWVLWVLIIPNVTPVVAKIMQPTPTIDKINAEKEAVEREIELRIDRLSAISGELSYGKEMSRKIDKLEDEGRRRRLQWDRFLDDATRRQVTLSQTLGRTSPAVCWTYAAATLTDTGVGRYRRLNEARTRLRQQMSDLRDEIARTDRLTGEIPEIKLEDLPRLTLTHQELGQALKEALTDVTILAVLNVVLFMVAFLMFLRYDVR